MTWSLCGTLTLLLRPKNQKKELWWGGFFFGRKGVVGNEKMGYN